MNQRVNRGGSAATGADLLVNVSQKRFPAASRVAIGRTLVVSRVFLLDEPLSTSDAELRADAY